MKNTVISFPWIGLQVNPDAVCFTIFGKSIYWYGVLIGAGFLLAVFYVMRRAAKFGLSRDNVIDMLIVAVPAAVIGARLYYVAFNWGIYAANPADIFKTWEGGLAIYGGIIGGITAAALFCRRKKISTGALLDLGSLGLLIGQGIGRWGNFFNREAFGRQTEVFWKMGLTAPGGITVYYHPTFLYEFLWNLAGFVLLHFFSKKRRKYDGQIFLMYIAWYGLGRCVIEGLRTDSLYLWGTGIRVSQLLAGLSFLICLAILIANRFREKKLIFAGQLASVGGGTAEPAEIQREESDTGMDKDNENRKEHDENGDNY